MHDVKLGIASQGPVVRRVDPPDSSFFKLFTNYEFDICSFIAFQHTTV